MKRRSLMAMLGLAPAAAVVSPGPIIEQPVNAVGWAEAEYDRSWMKTAREELSPVDSAKRRLASLLWQRERGLQLPDHLLRSWEVDPGIESRKATSPAIKKLLQHERIQRLAIEEAEANVKHQMVMAVAPDWVRRFL